MALTPRDSQYISGEVPREMLAEGVEVETTGIPQLDADGTPTHLTRISVPRPAMLPTPPTLPAVSAQLNSPQSTLGLVPQTLAYDFPLFPGVQCRIVLTGDARAAHLEQLREYIDVAARRLREEECRSTTEPRPARTSGRHGKKTAAPAP